MRSSKRRLEGYLMIDHRLTGAPGPAMNGGKRHGLYESSVVTCIHCQRQVVLRPDRTRERAWCFKCDRYLCDACGFLMKSNPCPGSYNSYLDRLQTQLIREGAR